MRIKLFIWIMIVCALSACTVGPKYFRPSIVIPEQYKEAPKGWKFADPQDSCNRGKWWLIFNDPILNELEEKLNISNQNIATALAQYSQARALVAAARAAYFPTLTGSFAATRQKRSTASQFNNPSTSAIASPPTASSVASSSPQANNVAFTLDATWEPDLWGAVRNAVEAAEDNAQASKDQLALTQLSSQASLAQFYFELRSVDVNQKLLDNAVENYKKILKISQNRYNVGTASQADVLQIKSQLEAEEALAIDNGINRAQYEHAIAVLIGTNPSCFTLKSSDSKVTVPTIPLEIPSNLLERRPDIAQAERFVAQANAEIGVAVAAYFPTLTLTGTGGYNGSGFSHLFSAPHQFWAIGLLLAQTIFDGGLRDANVKAAKAAYEAKVATYRQTVLTAFQDVEDNLASLRILGLEAKVQLQATQTALKSLSITTNEYKAGTVGTLEILNAEITALTAEINLNNVHYRQMTSAVGLIKALGGGWKVESSLPPTCPDKCQPDKPTCHVP